MDEDLFENIHEIRKKSMTATLNKETLSKYELDEIFVV